MTTDYNAKTKRRVIPRWRSATVSASAHEFRPLRPRSLPKGTPEAEVATRVREFEEAMTLGTAADALAAATMSGDPDRAKTAAQFIREHAEDSPPLLLSMAESALGGSPAFLAPEQALSDSQAVARIRSLLKVQPRSPGLWVDLSRHFAALGEPQRAFRSMQTAVGLAPAHRWVLRAANRLLLHLERPDDAHKLLIRNPRTKQDPWLISAELATAQILQRPARFMRQATDILRHKSQPAIHVSELATAVATTLLEEGNRKGARRLLRLALKEPTENALAQVEWAERESHDGLPVEPLVRSLADAYEADCWVKYNAGRMPEALAAARNWLRDEPFADRPVAMICHIAGVLDDYETLDEITKDMLARHPGEPIHRNNQIFARLSRLGYFDTATAKEVEADIDFLLRRVEAKQGDLAHSAANIGLYNYRMGRQAQGREWYDKARDLIEKAAQPGSALLAALATLYHAREAALARAPWLTEVLADARKRVKRSPLAGLEFHLRKVEAVAANPHRAGEILSLTSANEFLSATARAQITESLRLDRRGGRPVVWVPPQLRR